VVGDDLAAPARRRVLRCAGSHAQRREGGRKSPRRRPGQPPRAPGGALGDGARVRRDDGRPACAAASAERTVRREGRSGDVGHAAEVVKNAPWKVASAAGERAQPRSYPAS
jgi:hypothetical protein